MKKWSGKWIIDPAFKDLKPIELLHKQINEVVLDTHKENLKNRHMLIRKTFTLETIEEEAYIHISADDYYKLYINGHYIGQGPAPAYVSAYYYNSYEISSYLRKGHNVIAVHVYYQGLVNRVWNSGDYRQGMIAELFMNGKLILGTDQTWKYKISEAYQSGGTTGYETQYLENIDQRLWDEAWVQSECNENGWDDVEVNDADDHHLVLQPSQNLSVYEIEAKEIIKLNDRHYIIDFGQEITGQFLLQAQGKAGQRIEIRCAEELEEQPDEAGYYHVRYQLRCNCVYQEFWTLSGKEDKLNLYDYKAFRYVEIIGEKGTILYQPFKAIVRHYPFDDEAFTLRSSDEGFNKIVEICKNGVKYGAQEVFVDCPTREKGQYLGDFTITGHSHIYLTGETELYKKTLRDFANSSCICDGLMAVAPGGYMQEIADFSLQWPMQLYQYFQQTGDLVFLDEMYPYLVKLESYFRKFERADGLLVEVNEKWNLVDWPDNLRDGYDCDLTNPIGKTCHNVINAFYYGMMLYAEKIRGFLEKSPKHDLEKFKRTFQDVFYHEERGLFVDRENSLHSAIHSNALPLFFELFPEDYPKEAIMLLTTKAERCGVYMSYFLLKGLAKVGEHETVYHLIKKLWSTMIQEGATTCFEAWGKEQKWNTSLCHPWASAVIPILVEDIAGIKPRIPGWKEIDFSPNIPKALEDICLELNINGQRIRIEKKDNLVTLEYIGRKSLGRVKR